MKNGMRQPHVLYAELGSPSGAIWSMISVSRGDRDVGERGTRA